MNRDNLGKLLKATALRQGHFLTRSGNTVEQYFDKYLFESQPLLLAAVALQLLKLVKNDNSLIAGLEMGSIPIATAMSLACQRPVLFVRKKTKQYGTENIIEGGDVMSENIVIVEDVVSKGGSVLKAIHHIRAQGGIVQQVLCVLDREDGGRQSIEQSGIEFEALFLQSELF